MDKYRFVGFIVKCNDPRLEGKKLYVSKEDFKGEIMNPILTVHYGRRHNNYTLNGIDLEGDVKFETV